MLTQYLCFSIFILCSFLNSSFQESFTTSIGTCHLNIENSNSDLNLKKQIKLSTQSLFNQFGPVSKGAFYINIVSDENNIANFPKWASGIAIGNKIFIPHKKINKTVLNHELCHIYQHQ